MIPLQKFLELAHSQRWIWSALAVLIFWGALSAVTDRFSVASLSGIFCLPRTCRLSASGRCLW